jgi:hypothetical protein
MHSDILILGLILPLHQLDLHQTLLIDLLHLSVTLHRRFNNSLPRQAPICLARAQEKTGPHHSYLGHRWLCSQIIMNLPSRTGLQIS